MNQLHTLSLLRPIALMTKILIVSFLVCSGCENSEPETYDASKCYEASVIRGFCPSVVVATVTNANIGVNWRWEGNTYKNAITISNFEVSDTVGSTDRKIYFTIDIAATTENGGKCFLPKPCLLWAFDQSAPEVAICIKSVSTKPCTTL